MVLTLVAAALLAQAPPVPGRGRSTPSRPPALEVRAEDLGSLAGQVVSSTDGSPLRKATVTLRRVDGGGERESPFIGNTDASGRFTFEQVPPGRYDLHVERNGFVSQDLSSRRAGGPGRQLTLAKAERMTGVQVKLIPQGVVTGRVLDEDGDPMPLVQVTLNRWIYTQGRKQLVPQGGAQTDDRGEFRAHGLAPGKYVVSAISRTGMREGGPPRPNQSTRDQRPDEAYPAVYYPGAADPAQAGLIEVTPGANLPGVDFQLRRIQTVRVRGKVLRPAESRRPAMVTLVPRSTEGNFGLMTALRGMADPSGNFEVRGVGPGAYWAHVEDWDREQRMTATAAVDVGRTHVDNVVLRLTPGIELAGELVYEDTPEPPTAAPGISLRGLMFAGGSTAQVKDGRFALKNVALGRYDVTVNGLPAGFYVKSIRAGDQDLLSGSLEVGEAPPGVLRIVASPHGAHLEGTVTRDQKPAAGGTVVLWPVTPGARPTLFRSSTTDQTGRFVIAGIAPGEYRVAAFGNLEPGAWQDPDFLKEYASKAEKVTLQEKARENRMLVELTL